MEIDLGVIEREAAAAPDIYIAIHVICVRGRAVDNTTRIVGDLEIGVTGQVTGWQDMTRIAARLDSRRVYAN